MTTELDNLIFAEKYRPQRFEELISSNKEMILSYLSNPKTLPSFIFYSQAPGTGKTSMAKLIIKYLDCDSLIINSSDERGIDTIREKIKSFVISMSNNPDSKRCVFLDESDSMTRIAQDSLRNLMETYSDNCFFIFSCNDVSKIIDPIKSRCVNVSFEQLNKKEILNRLRYICQEEKLEIKDIELDDLVRYDYPDLRTMIKKIQMCKITNTNTISNSQDDYEIFFDAVKRKDISFVYEKVYSGTFDIMGFNKWFFRQLFENYKKYDSEIASTIAYLLADTEKNWNLGSNLEIVFISNILKISKVL